LILRFTSINLFYSSLLKLTKTPQLGAVFFFNLKELMY
jgi:hypothetical protein